MSWSALPAAYSQSGLRPCARLRCTTLVVSLGQVMIARQGSLTGLLLSVLPLLDPMICLLVSRAISGYHTCIELAVL